jgi:aspartate/methionine/tyrosine aminotransferase
MVHVAINLAQGFSDFPAPAEIKQAAQEAIGADENQYAITWGAKSLRGAIARQMEAWQGVKVDPEKQVTVCCGSTEAMISTLMAVCNAGDEVVIFEPYYENYGPDSILSGAKPRFVKLRPPRAAGGEWTFDEQELRRAFHKNTKAIIVNTPNNPTGKVFTRAELELIRDLCVEFDVLAITVELCEQLLYDGWLFRWHLPAWRKDDHHPNVENPGVTGWRGVDDQRRITDTIHHARLPDSRCAGTAAGGRGFGVEHAESYQRTGRGLSKSGATGWCPCWRTGLRCHPEAHTT